MQDNTEAVLKLADANDVTGDSLFTELIPAMQVYGLTTDDLTSKSDELTAITHSTQYSLSDVGNILDQTGVKASTMGLSFDDTAAIVEILGQKGIPTKQAIADINKAAGDGSGSQSDFYKALGITNDQLGNAKSKLGDATGATDAYAKIIDDHATTMQKLGND